MQFYFLTQRIKYEILSLATNHRGKSMNITDIMKYNRDITGTYLNIKDQQFNDLSILGAAISGSKIENTVYENIIFENCSFQSTDFINVIFIDCKFKNCIFNFVKFKDCNQIACKMENCLFCITNSLNCNFLSCTYINNSWLGSNNQGRFITCNLEDAELNTMDDACQSTVALSPFSNSQLQAA